MFLKSLTTKSVKVKKILQNRTFFTWLLGSIIPFTDIYKILSYLLLRGKRGKVPSPQRPAPGVSGAALKSSSPPHAEQLSSGRARDVASFQAQTQLP